MMLCDRMQYILKFFLYTHSSMANLGTLKELAPGILVDLYQGEVSIDGGPLKKVPDPQFLTLVTLRTDVQRREDIAARLKKLPATVSVEICRLRQAGVPIKTRWKQGYSLDVKK